MASIVCKCGCNIFKEIKTASYKEEDFFIIKPMDRIRVGCAGIVFLECISCGLYVLPNVSFAGKNILDPEVQMYKETLSFIDMHNKRIEANNVKTESTGRGDTKESGSQLQERGRSKQNLKK